MRTRTNTKKALVTLALAASSTGLASASGPQRLDKRQQFTGRTTVYIAETGNEGTCGGFLSNGGMTVALNSNQWDGGSHCGQQLTINYQGRSVTVTVRDQCPGCPWGSLDLTPGAWSALTGGAAWGEAYTSWSWGSGNGGGNNNNNGGNNQQTTSTTPKWTPPATSSTPKWTPPPPSPTSEKPSTTWTPSTTSRTSTSSSSVWTPPTTFSSSTPPPSSSSSSSTSSSSSSSSSSISSSAVSTNATSSAVGNSTAVSSALGDLVTTTLSFDNGTHTTATLAIESGVTSTLTAPIAGSTTKGALGNVNQVVLQMANIIVNAVEADE